MNATRMTSPQLFDLTGKVALISGGNSGIGLAIAASLKEAGAMVVIAGRSPAKNETALEAINRDGSKDRDGSKAWAQEADVANESDCRRLIARVSDTLGRMDILVNAAGINVRKQPEQFSIEEWSRILDINLTGTFLLSKEALPLLQKNGGKIVNIGSMTSIFGAPFAAPYSASKGGIVQLTKSLAVAWARYNIQVNAILPGWVDTPLTGQLRRDLPEMNASILSRTPAGRWGQPEDFAGISLFLASSASNFVTGAAICVDGGYSSQV